jgi:hypothetical protein
MLKKREMWSEKGEKKCQRGRSKRKGFLLKLLLSQIDWKRRMMMKWGDEVRRGRRGG